MANSSARLTLRPALTVRGLENPPVWKPLGYLAVLVAVVLVGLPMYWMLLAAVKTNQEIFTAPPTWIPLAPPLDNFPAAWQQAPFGNFYVNSILYTVIGG